MIASYLVVATFPQRNFQVGLTANLRDQQCDLLSLFLIFLLLVFSMKICRKEVRRLIADLDLLCHAQSHSLGV